MMKLFRLVNYEVTISEEALTLAKFRKIWDRDRTQGKLKAQQELAFIYFYADPRSDYAAIIDDEDREKEIKKGLGLKDDWVIDRDLSAAIDFYKSFKPTICLALDDARLQLEKVRTKLRNISLENVKIKDISDFIKANSDVNKAIDLFCEIEKKVNREIQESTKMRGVAEKKLFDEGIDL